MEWQFQINWPVIVEEARLRRKTQRLTQKRLAMLAGVSTPTLSRFENGGKDIQLSSIMGILSVLGMVDSRNLLFPKAAARYDSRTDAVVFSGRDGEKQVPCAILREALGNADPLRMFAKNRECIGHEARKKYLAGQLEADGSVLIRNFELVTTQ